MSQDGEQAPSRSAYEGKLQAILETAATAIIAIDSRGLIESINPATEKLFGYDGSELIGRNVSLLMPEPYRSQHDTFIKSFLRTGYKKIIGIGREVSGQRKDGTTFPIHLAVSEFEADGRTYFTGIIHDLSDRKHVEEALRESERRLALSQKMEAVGQLTGGIAHDFNNLLLVITGNLELLEAKIDREDLRALLKEAQDAAELGSRLTDQLLTFARRRYLEPQLIGLNDLVIGVADLLRRTLGEHVSLSTVLAPRLWKTRADPGQTQSAVVNLAVNARDAMPKGGKLVVETRNVTLDPDHAGADPNLTPGDYVQVSVSDTGTGMPPEVRDRAFEPFFTTKAKGHGTGLGLAMVYGFVKQSGGHATIYSETGVGTTVNLYLPRADADGIEPGPQDDDRPVEPVDGEVVLVVEDDQRVRALTVSRLKLLGYSVLEACDGPTALEILGGHAHIDLLFTDLVMPGGLSGRDIVERARQVHPRIKVLLSSGYAEELIQGDERTGATFRVLRKPYRQAELARVLREILTAS